MTPRSESRRTSRPRAARQAHALGAALAILCGAAPAAHAVVRSCGPDAIANTDAVLCAPPSGPCDATRVVVGAGIQILDGTTCRFNLGGRALVVDRTFETAGPSVGSRFENAGDVTVTATGKLKARGDLVTPFGFIAAGGGIAVQSSGSILIQGVLDVSGDGGGEIVLRAPGDVTFAGGSEVVGRGISTFLDEGERFADGGDLEVIAGGRLTLDGTLVLTGQSLGAGGIVVLDGRDVAVQAKIDITGGGSDGGDLDVTASDDILVTRSVDADSKSGGGYGGFMAFSAGNDHLPGDAHPGGSLAIAKATLTARGSDTDQFGGDGGELSADASGNLTLSDVVIRLDAATSFDGFGGTLWLDTKFTSTPIGRGTIDVAGTVSARSGNSAGAGGSLIADAGRDLVLRAAIDVSGTDEGGDVDCLAAGGIHLGGAITNLGLRPWSGSGEIVAVAGLEADAPLIVSKSILAADGSGSNQPLTLAGCTLIVADGVKVDRRGSGPDGPLELVSLHPMQIGAGAQFLAGPAGRIFLTHPAGADPVIGAGVVFDPAPTHDTVGLHAIPPCPAPVCGNGLIEAGEECDDANADDGDGCSAACMVRCAAAPLPECRRPVSAGKAQLLIENRPDAARDRLIWRWLKGTATSVDDFGDPVNTDDYVLCLYDQSGAAPLLALEAAAPAGGTCAGRPCWRSVARGFAYADPDRTPAGLDTLDLTAGGDGDASVVVTGRGETLALPALPLALPARVQLQGMHGQCWEATFAAAAKNDGTYLEAQGD